MTTDKLPPHSVEAEQAVLGALLTDFKVAFPIVSEAIGNELGYFYDARHTLIYEQLTRMAQNGKPINGTTVYIELKSDGRIDAIGGLEYLCKLADACISPSGVGYFCEILAEMFQKRKLIAVAAEATVDAYDGLSVADTLNRTSRALRDLVSQTAKKQQQDIKCLVQAALTDIENYHATNGEITGVRSGFADLDKMTRGFQAGEMIVIAGRPSMGKTSLAMNIAEHAAVEQRLPVAVFSLEMTARSLVMRMICSRARINLRNIQSGFLNDHELPRIASAAGKIASAPIYIDDTSGLSIFDLQARARRLMDERQIKLIVIDYLQLMSGSRRHHDSNRQSEVSEISNGCKWLAKELSVPVIVLSQLNRDSEREKNRRPRLVDLRESGSIEQDADFVALLWKRGEEDREEDEGFEVRLTVAKQRNGPTGDIGLTFLKTYTRFENIARIDEQMRKAAQ